MVTYEQAISENEFHYELRSGCEKKVERWRRNGKTQTWKTRPGKFSVPVKFGLRSYAYITDGNAGEFHAASGCEHG